MTLIDTRSGPPACQGAAGSIHCSGRRTVTAAGTHYLTVWKLTTARATVEVRADWSGMGSDAVARAAA